MEKNIEVCRTCHFFVGSNFYAHGECRRHSPEVGSQFEQYSNAGHKAEWPIVNEGDWCGDFEYRIFTPGVGTAVVVNDLLVGELIKVDAELIQVTPELVKAILGAAGKASGNESQTEETS